MKLVTFGKQSQKLLKPSSIRLYNLRLLLLLILINMAYLLIILIEGITLLKRDLIEKTHLLITCIVIIVVKRVSLLQSTNLGDFFFS